ADGLRRADKLTQLAGHALGAVFLVLHQIRRAAVTRRHGPLFLGILHRHFFAEEMADGDLEPADDPRQVKPFPKTQFVAVYNHLFNLPKTLTIQQWRWKANPSD